MKKRKLNRLQQLAKKRQEKLAKKQAQTAANKFARANKAKKNRERFHFVSDEGKIVKSSRRKGWLVYVQKNGKAVPVDRLLKRKVRKRLRKDYPTQSTRKKRAIDKERKSVREEIIDLETHCIKDRRGIRYDRLFDWMIKILLRLQRKLRPTQGFWVIDFETIATTLEGVDKTITGFKFLEVPIDKEKIWKPIYGVIAELLSDADLVLRGSFAFVSKLSENRGKERSKWTKRKLAWGTKANSDIVQITKFCFQLRRVKMA